MKAVQINQYGGNEVVEINETPIPVPGVDQVLIEVHASSINPVDWKVRAGFLKDMVSLEFPTTLGGDFAGVIIEVGSSVTDFKVGDKIFGQAGVLNGGSGSFAEFAVGKIDKIAYKPKSLDFIEASALPLVGASALQALEEHIRLQSGQKILIHGGAGGIGSITIQLAKQMGAYVATTVGSDDKEYVKGLGADKVIDYKNEQFEIVLKDYDGVFDTVGGETTDKSFQVLKKGGVLVSMVGQPSKELAEKFNVTVIGQGTKANSKHFSRLAELADSGKIKINVDKVFILGEAKEAIEYQEKGHPRGKVVLKIKLLSYFL